MTNKTKYLLSGGLLLVSSAYAYYFFTKKNKDEKKSVLDTVTSNPKETAVAPVSTANNASIAAVPIAQQIPQDKAVFSTNSGYQKFGTGLIIQFGYSGKSVRFPIPFPNTCISVSSSTSRSNAGSLGFNHATAVTKTGFTQIIDGSFGYWIAIGY